MRILSAVNSAAEVNVLRAAGADELFCGIYEKGDVSHGNRALNRREGLGHSLDGLDEFGEVAAAAADAGLPLHVALNSFYATAVLAAAKRQAERTLAYRPAGFIVSDIAMLLHLRRIGWPGHVSISVGGVALNSQAMLFYRELGADRVVLPRQLSLAEIAALKDAPVDKEVIVLESRCFFMDGFCNFHHTVVKGASFDAGSSRFLARQVMPRLKSLAGSRRQRKLLLRLVGRGPAAFGRVCSCPFEIAPLAADGGVLPADDRSRKVASIFGGHTVEKACGLCFLPELVRGGITHLKIANRGMTLAAKTATVRFARSALDAVGEFGGAAPFREAIRRGYGQCYQASCDERNCYLHE